MSCTYTFFGQWHLHSIGCTIFFMVTLTDVCVLLDVQTPFWGYLYAIGCTENFFWSLTSAFYWMHKNLFLGSQTVCRCTDTFLGHWHLHSIGCTQTRFLWSQASVCYWMYKHLFLVTDICILLDAHRLLLWSQTVCYWMSRHLFWSLTSAFYWMHRKLFW